MGFIKNIFGGETAKRIGKYVFKMFVREGRAAFEKKYGELTFATVVQLVESRGAGLDEVWDDAFHSVKSQAVADGAQHADTWIARLMIDSYESMKAQQAKRLNAEN